MRAGYFPELGVAEFRSDMPEPQIRYDKDVKIRIRKCGICGSRFTPCMECTRSVSPGPFRP